MAAIELAVDVVFALDIWFNFRTAYVDSTGGLQTDQGKIVRHYLRTWCVVRCCCCFGEG